MENKISLNDVKAVESFKKFCLKNKFFPPKNRIEYLYRIYTSLSSGNPVLIKGEIGSSKTSSAEIICQYICAKNGLYYKDEYGEEKTYIKYDLNSETKIPDLILKIIEDKNYYSGIKILEGPFYKAFKYGIPLILDGVNSVSEEVLQCIESSLDSKMINIEIPKIGLIKQEMNEGFCLIVIQRTYRIIYDKNQEIKINDKFLSHFQEIKFHNYDADEVLQISTELLKSIDLYKKNVQNVIAMSFAHSGMLSFTEKNTGNFYCTIRDALSCIKAMSVKVEESKFLGIVYGSRFKNGEGIFKKTNDFDNYIPEEIKEDIYSNIALIRLFECAIISLNLERNIIIKGEKGSGKTMISKWIANTFNLEKNNDKNSYYYYICTKNTKYSDLIGYYHLQKNDYGIYYEWKDGFITDAIKNGKIVILDDLHEVDSQILERLNSLFDIQYKDDIIYGNKEKKFEIQENQRENSIPIHKNFRIIGVCDSKRMNQITPSFINRFIIVNLDNQLDNINKENLKELVHVLFYKNEQNKDLFSKIELENEKLLNLISYLSEKLYKTLQESKFNLSIKDIARLLFSLKKIIKLEYLQNIDYKKLTTFIYDILFNEEQFNIDIEIKQAILNHLKKNFTYNDFIFEKNINLENIIVIVYTSFLIKLPVCIMGPKGIGKTVFLKFMIDILKEEKEFRFYPYYNNKLENIGQEMINKNNNNPLLESAKEGYIFIADEIDISSESKNSLLIPFLDPMNNKNIFIPSMNQSINFEEKFYFIASQTYQEISSNEFFEKLLQGIIIQKNDIFSNIKKNIKIIKYPELNDKNILDIIRKKNYSIYSEKKFSNEEKSFIAKFILKYNNFIDENTINLKQWSLKDIDKILKKINKLLHQDNFLNFKFYHFIYFIFFSSIPKNELLKEYNYLNKKRSLKLILHDIFIKTFELDNENSKELEICFFDKIKFDIKNKIIMKGNIGLKIPNDYLTKNFEKLNIDDTIYQIYDSIFKLNLYTYEEPIILLGPSSYRIDLLKLHFGNNNFKIIYCEQESEIDKLLNIIKEPLNGENNNYELINNNNIDFHKIISLSKNYPIISELINKTLKESIIDKVSKFMVRQGSIIWYILRSESIVLKNIHKFPFEKSYNLNLLIYINDWFHQNFSFGINLIGICPDIILKNIHKNILSEFSIFCVEEYDSEAKFKFIDNYSRALNITEEFINLIKCDYQKKMFKNIKNLKFFIKIFSKMNEKNKEFKYNYNYLQSLFLMKKSVEIEKIYEKKVSSLYNSNNYIFSSASKLKIPILKNDKHDDIELKKDIIYTPLINKFLDIIHLAICTNTPLVLEGYPGEGKKKAINYVKSLLNYKIRNIFITKYFTMNDWIQEIDNIKENSENVIFIFHNINDANPEIFSKISEIFNYKEKNAFIIIGIINKNYEFQDKILFENEKSEFEKYFQNCIYYIINYYQHYFCVNEIISNIQNFDPSIIIKYNRIGNIFNLNETNKFIKLKKFFDLKDKFIVDILEKKNTIPLINSNYYSSPFDSLKWVFKNSNKDVVTIQIDNESFILNSNNYLDIQKCLNTLSSDQKRCFIFLTLSYISNICCIVKGPTGIGKSYLILLLSKILKKKLIVIQLNRDNNNYQLQNQLYLKDNLKMDKKNYLFKLEKNRENNNEEDFQDYNQMAKINDRQKDKLKTENNLKDNFERKNSTILEAIKNGDWVLLDGIENSLNIFSQILKIIYPDEQRMNELILNKNFRLFITYNKSNLDDIPKDITEKCLVYDLKSFIDNKNSIYEIINGFLRNLNYFENEKLINDYSLKLANIHMILLEKINNESNSQNKISERTFINFCKTLSLDDEENQSLNHKFIKHFLYYYFPFYDEKETFKFIEIIRENMKFSDYKDTIQKNSIIIPNNKQKKIFRTITVYTPKGTLTIAGGIKFKSITINKDGMEFAEEEDEDEDEISYPKKSYRIPHKIINKLDSDDKIQNFIITLDRMPNKTYILKKIKINLKNIENELINEFEKIISLNSIYINQILCYYVECVKTMEELKNNKSRGKEFLCIIMENNTKLKTILNNSIPINIIWTIFFRIIAGINSLESKNLIIKNFDIKDLYIDNNNNVQFDITIFISHFFYQYNKYDLDDASPVKSLRTQLFKLNINDQNKNVSLEEIIYENFFKSLMDILLCKDNFELVLFYFNSLKYFFVEYDIRNMSFDVSNLLCKNCKILQEIYLKDENNLLFRCTKCFFVKNIKIENIRDDIFTKKISIKNLLSINDKKNHLKYINYLKEFPINLRDKYIFIKNIIDELLEKSEDIKSEKHIFNDIIINIMKIYINDLIKYSNLVHLYLNIFFLLISDNISEDLIKQYKSVMKTIYHYFSENEIKKFKIPIKKEKENFFILYDNIFEKAMNELKSIVKDFFKPISSNISDLEKNKKYIENNIRYSYILNKYITIEKIKNKEKYINIEELLNNIEYITAKTYDSSNRNFILSVLAKGIENNGIKVCISKTEDKCLNNIEFTSLQSLLSLGNQIKYEFQFDFGQVTNNKIINDEIYRNNFMKTLKTKIAKKIGINEQNLIFEYFRHRSIIIFIYPINISYEKEKSLKLLKKENDLHIINIKKKPLLEALLISPKILNPLGDKYLRWGKNEIRGGENYIPPEEDWIGFGLDVLGRYDNGNDSWLGYKNEEGEFAVGYSGFNNFLIKNFSNLIDKNLVNVQNERLYYEQKNQRDLSFFKGKCQGGICIFQDLHDAENFAGIVEINQKMRIKIILMCRINSKKIRQPKNYNKFWILNPTPDEIRPYRILIKKIPISPLIGTLNDILITSQNPIEYIISAINNKDNSFYSTVNQYPEYAILNKQKLNDDFAIIKFYTGEFYCYLNNYLRNKERVDLFEEKDFFSWIYCLQLALKRNINVLEGTNVYRGVNKKFSEEILVGSKFFFREFTSCTTSLEQALHFAGSLGTILVITIKNNEKQNYCFSVKDISVVPNEDEILISCHCYYTVNKIEKKDYLDYYYLTCEGYFNFKIENGEVKANE